MSGDYTRFSFKPRKRFSGVLQQQGRVQLDSDWNEAIAIIKRRARVQSLDTFGPVGVPQLSTPNAFKVGAISGPPPDLSLQPGRIYVDGLLAELFDDEAATYLKQPFLPAPPPLPAGGGIVFLDVWEREVTYIEDPTLLDVALGGADTATRTQTVWQVGVNAHDNPTCGAFVKPPASAGRLTTEAIAPPTPDDPCILPPVAGYRGLENRLYRVEVHKPGPLGTANFKWSRDNGSIVSAVTAIAVSGGQTTLTVNRIGRDQFLRFFIDNWVTVTDDYRELMGETGDMARIIDIDEANSRIVLDRPLPAPGARAFGATAKDLSDRHTRIQRWDQTATTNTIDADGLVATAAGPIDLEDGIRIRFATDPPGGSFLIGDYWVFWARTATASIELLDHAPPRGIHHHYCALATINVGGSGVQVTGDCRPPPPSVTTAGDCACTVCVSAEQHNSGAFTLAMAVAKVKPTGGRICLGVGIFLLRETLVLQGVNNITLVGQALTTALVHFGPGPAIQIENSVDVRIESLSVFAFAAASPRAGPALGIRALNSMAVTVQDCLVLAAPTEASPAPPTVGPVGFVGLPQLASIAIALDGFLVDGVFRNNLLNADIGIGKTPGDIAKAWLLLVGLRVQENFFFCKEAAVALGDQLPAQRGGLTLYALESMIEANFAFEGNIAGILVDGVVLPGAALRIERNQIEVAGVGIGCGTQDGTIADNHVTQWDLAGALSGIATTTIPRSRVAGVLVFRPPGREFMPGQFRIMRNRVVGIGGPGILIDAPVGIATIAQNAIGNVIGGGIAMSPQAAANEVTISDNEIVGVVGPPLPGEENVPTIGPAILGIGVSNTVVSRISGNTLGLIGLDSTANAFAVGIRLHKVQTSTVALNFVTDVEAKVGQWAPNLGPSGVAILVGNGYNDVAVEGNRIRQTEGVPPLGNWYAVLIIGQSGSKAPTLVKNNVMDGNSREPLVQISDGGDCVLTSNHCRNATDRTASGATINITADTIIAGDNRVDGAGIALDTVPWVEPGRVTVLGNIVRSTQAGVTAQIRVHNTALQDPWAKLNIFPVL
jgi:hypothetical protein